MVLNSMLKEGNEPGYTYKVVVIKKKEFWSSIIENLMELMEPNLVDVHIIPPIFD